MGKGDLRGLSPGLATPARKPRPFLAHPRKPVPAAPRHRAAQRVRTLELRHSGERRLLQREARGWGLRGAPAQEDAQGFQVGLKRVWGSLCKVSVLWTTAPPGPLQRLHREGSGPPESSSSPFHPAETQREVGTESRFLAAWPGVGARSAAAVVRTTFFRPLFSSKLGIHGDWARQPDSPTA